MWIIIIIFSLMFSYMSQYTIGGRYIKWLWFLILVHLMVAIINAYFYTFSPLAADAIRFHNDAIAMASGSITNFSWHGSVVYPYFLSYVYRIDPSIMTGQSLSIFAYTMSAIVLGRFCYLLKLEKYKVLILLCFSLNPMGLIIQSGVLRESWQVLFFMLACYFSVKICLYNRFLNQNIVWLVAFVLLGSILHVGVMAGSFFVLFSTIFYLFFVPKQVYFEKSLVVVIFMLFIGLVVISFYFVKQNFPDMYQHAITYTQSVGDANTQYSIDRTSLGVLVIPWVLIYYLFYPFIWNIHDIISLYGAIVGLIRLILLYGVYRLIKKEKNILYKRLYIILFLQIIFIAFIFSFGTNNYGTGMRHMLLTFWGLALLGIPGLFKRRHYE